MSFLLDTNILSAHLKRPSGLAHRFNQHSGRLYTSTVALAELYVWAHHKTNSVAAFASIDLLLNYEVSPVPYDKNSAIEFGRLKVDLRKRGVPVGTPDLLIASVALTYNLVLVTHNTKDFQNIPNLQLEDWLLP